MLTSGQTYSGKTYTMGSNIVSNTPVDSMGIIPRVFDDIFNCEPLNDGMEHVFKVTFLEIYQEQIKDLLSPQTNNREISIRESKDGTIVLSGITERVVKSGEEMQECLIMGSQQRSTGDTLMHSHSSRSHAIFTITLEKVSHLAHDSQLDMSPIEPVVVQRSKLHLVDLAGSERLKRTGAEGVRLKESVKINSGLLALGNVISILGDEKQENERPHVPYRDSKLTRLLQDSLGGNSQTVMLACVSPLESDMDETVNTLKYAYRARRIQNKPIINTIDQIALERTNMQHKIDELEGKLKGLQDHGIVPTKIAPEMIDFDNEQWMQYFMDQLKMRTIRGTNAVKALEKANKENEELKSQLVRMREYQPNEEIQNQFVMLQKDYDELKLQSANWKETIQVMLQFCLKVIKGITPTTEESEKIKSLIKSFCPSEKIEEVPETTSTSLFPPIHQNGLNTRAPSTNSVARSHRRKRISSEENQHEDVHLKPLETELRETRKYLSQMEEELSRTKIILQQNEAISAQSSNEITRLMQVNDTLRSQLLGAGISAEVNPEIVSIKTIREASSQTLDQFVVPTHQENQNNNEKIMEELAAATKAKVDLLKELSKTNKDIEKQRHLHADQIQKLEREVEAKEREINKMQDELKSKEALKDKQKEEFERRFKNHESNIAKYKNKVKELEKSLKYQNPDRKLNEAQQELEKLQMQIQTLKKKAKEDLEKYNELEIRKSKEIVVLEKQLDEQTIKSRHLEVKAEMIRKKLDKKLEESHSSPRKSSIPTPKKSKSVTDTLVPEAHTIRLEQLAKTEIDVEGEVAELEEGNSSVIELHKHHQKLHGQENFNMDTTELDLSEYQSLFDRFVSDDQLQTIIEKTKLLHSHEAVTLICDCLQEIAETRDHIVQLEFEKSQLKSNLDTEKEQVDALEKKSHKIIRTYEKKLAVLEKVSKFNQKIEELSEPVKPLSASSEVQTEVTENVEKVTHKDLEKDVFYYRNANKELKSKLREVVAVNHRLAKTLQERVKTAENPSFPVAVE